jgi:hypothetical protein
VQSKLVSFFLESKTKKVSEQDLGDGSDVATTGRCLPLNKTASKSRRYYDTTVRASLTEQYRGGLWSQRSTLDLVNTKYNSVCSLMVSSHLYKDSAAF